MSGVVKCLNPINQRHLSLNKESPDQIVDGAYHTLGLTILLGCVWTREPELSPCECKLIMK